MPILKHTQPPAAPTTAASASPLSMAWAAPPPRGRPSWSGLLRLSLVSVPIKAYPAVSSTSASHFHLLHADCGQRISYAKHCPQHDPVEGDAIVRGYEYAADQYVVVEPQELEQLRPARDKALVLEQFLPVQDIAPTFFAGRSLYLLPDGPAAPAAAGALSAESLLGRAGVVLPGAVCRLDQPRPPAARCLPRFAGEPGVRRRSNALLGPTGTRQRVPSTLVPASSPPSPAVVLAGLCAGKTLPISAEFP